MAKSLSSADALNVIESPKQSQRRLARKPEQKARQGNGSVETWGLNVTIDESLRVPLAMARASERKTMRQIVEPLLADYLTANGYL